MELRAVLFDLWGTLIVDPETRWRPRALWRAKNVRGVLATGGFDVSFDAVFAALEAAGRELSALHDEGLDLSEDGRVDLVLDRLDVRVDVAAEARVRLVEAICTMHPLHKPDPHDGALEVLRAVKALGLPTALVSNAGLTTAPNLRLMLDEYGMAKFLDVCVFSDDLELAKPDARLFQAALEGLGVDARLAAFVGDSPHNDIFGARQAGLLAVQIGHREAPPRTGYSESDGARPDARIGSLHELLPAIEGFIALPGRRLSRYR
jgi:putative hydrolase of the HAD superfamily